MWFVYVCCILYALTKEKKKQKETTKEGVEVWKQIWKREAANRVISERIKKRDFEGTVDELVNEVYKEYGVK